MKMFIKNKTQRTYKGKPLDTNGVKKIPDRKLTCIISKKEFKSKQELKSYRENNKAEFESARTLFYKNKLQNKIMEIYKNTNILIDTVIKLKSYANVSDEQYDAECYTETVNINGENITYDNNNITYESRKMIRWQKIGGYL